MRPDEAALLVLDVQQPAHAGREELLLVGDAVVVRVGVLPDLVGVRFLREDRVGAERHHEAREDQVVDEDVVRLVDAVVVLVLVHRDAADRVELAAAVGVLHVAAQLEHEHPAVAVEGDLRRLLDVGIGEHRLDLESGRQPELLLLLGRRQRNDRRLLREVGLVHRRAAAASGAACAALSSWVTRRRREGPAESASGGAP